MPTTTGAGWDEGTMDQGRMVKRRAAVHRVDDALADLRDRRRSVGAARAATAPLGRGVRRRGLRLGRGVPRLRAPGQRQVPCAGRQPDRPERIGAAGAAASDRTGAVDYLRKPFDDTTLLDAINRAIRGS